MKPFTFFQSLGKIGLILVLQSFINYSFEDHSAVDANLQLYLGIEKNEEMSGKKHCF